MSKSSFYNDGYLAGKNGEDGNLPDIAIYADEYTDGFNAGYRKFIKQCELDKPFDFLKYEGSNDSFDLDYILGF